MPAPIGIHGLKNSSLPGARKVFWLPTLNLLIMVIGNSFNLLMARHIPAAAFSAQFALAGWEKRISAMNTPVQLQEPID